MRQWIVKGYVPSFRIGRRLLRVDLDDLDALVTSIPRGVPNEPIYPCCTQGRATRCRAHGRAIGRASRLPRIGARDVRGRAAHPAAALLARLAEAYGCSLNDLHDRHDPATRYTAEADEWVRNFPPITEAQRRELRMLLADYPPALT
jgi:hypothetical protein